MAVDYDSWRTASPYDDYIQDPEGWVREEDVPSLEDTQDFLGGIIEALQNKDNNMLTHCLEELCHIYDVEYKEVAI